MAGRPAIKHSLRSSAEKTISPFHAVDLEFLTIDSVCDHDLYLRTNNQYVLYRAARLPFTQKDKLRLEETKQSTIFIYCQTEKDVRRFYEHNLSNIIDNKKISTQTKADVLFKCASGIAKEIFDAPENKENIGKTRDVVNNTMSLLAQGTDAFLQIISLSGHDYHTYTHCVNVMAFSVSLLSSLGVKDPELLKQTGIGALLHDIGKSKIPLSILNKPGPLTDSEWALMKKHPSFGAEMLAKAPVPELGRSIVVQHHEKISGTGYPFGLRKEKIDLSSQVVALCDAYDAMTTNRIYQPAIKPYQALQIITQEMRGHYDIEIVEKFIQLLNLKKD